jgi:2-dehydro-3-deoxyphosphooctonate aldolase (KDO 8-P synthase)
MSERVVQISDGVAIGGPRLTVFAGPCVIESEEHVVDVAGRIKEICSELDVAYVFKSSFDMANRTSLTSFRGPGLDDGMKALDAVKRHHDVPVVTDIHETWQAEPAGAVADVLQIPAFLCRQTDLLVAAARTGRVVNVKKGQFLAPHEMAHVVAKVREAGSDKLVLTERGSSFGYNTLVVDFRSLPQLRSYGFPVMLDATHSVQQPGAAGGRSGGQRQFVPYLARAAAAVGVDGLFMEVHPDPASAPSDGPNMVPLHELAELLEGVLAIRAATQPLPPVEP